MFCLPKGTLALLCSAEDYLHACLKAEPILATAAAAAAAAADASTAAAAQVMHVAFVASDAHYAAWRSIALLAAASKRLDTTHRVPMEVII